MILPLLAVLAVQAVPEDAATLVQRLNADLLSDPSATAVLIRWCADRRLADPPTVVAIVDRTATNPPTPEQRARLQAGSDEPIAYRRVRLSCGNHVLSQAENWYLPGRLTEAMRAQLAGDTPFGTVIRPLRPQRQTLGIEALWDRQGAVPQEVLRHRALVLDGEGRPLAEVRETYQRDLVTAAE